MTDISTLGSKFVESLKYTPQQRLNVEACTQSQGQSKRWFEERQFRLTASKFGVIVKRRRQHTSLVHQLLYTSVSPSVSALQWGRDHEPDALHKYRQTLSDDMTLISASFYVDQCGFLGASPDGIVIDASEKAVCLVEVKCPFNAQEKTVEEACSDIKSFCSTICEQQPCLKTSHDYYYQVQGQMAVTGIHACDFVLWTPKDVRIQRIYFDNEFWSNTCLPKLEHFFFYFFLPEIIYPKQTSSLIHDYSQHKTCMY